MCGHSVHVSKLNIYFITGSCSPSIQSVVNERNSRTGPDRRFTRSCPFYIHRPRTGKCCQQKPSISLHQSEHLIPLDFDLRAKLGQRN